MSREAKSGGLGFLSILTLIFITLRLLEVITWSWWMVLAPMWIPVVFVLIILLVVFVVCVVKAVFWD